MFKLEKTPILLCQGHLEFSRQTKLDKKVPRQIREHSIRDNYLATREFRENYPEKFLRLRE
jgi:hypothetical protein